MLLVHVARKRLMGFLFPAESDRWVSILRLGLSIQVIAYAWSARADWIELFARSGRGLGNRELTEVILSVQSPLAPRLGWLVSVGRHVGISEAIVLWTAWSCLLCAGVLLLFGLFSRPAAVAAWLLHLCAVKSEQLLTYGMDNFTTIGLFYLMLAPLPDRLALDMRLWRAHTGDPQTLGFWRRVLQVHLCFIYLFGGITKALSFEWWNGTSIWRALTSPPYNVISPQVLVTSKYLLPLLGVGIWLLETGYPIFIWPKKTRTFWLVSIISVHVAIGLSMGLYLFAFILIVLNAAGFAPDWVWRRDVPCDAEANSAGLLSTKPSNIGILPKGEPPRRCRGD
jgi:hypothetical protein